MSSFCIIIPTRNRPDDLGRCLGSITDQVRLPDAVVVIDDGELGDAFVEDWRQKLGARGIKLVYHHKNHAIEPQGTSVSRNKALELVTTPVFFILDDDVILDPDFCQRIMAVWEGGSGGDSLIGVGGVINNNRCRRWPERIFHKIFGLSSKRAWDVNPIGFQNWDDHIKERAVGHYAHGGVCSYDLAKTRQLGGWATFSGGRTALEDVEFCARAKQKGWHFIIEPAAKLEHHPSPVSREGDYLVGQKEAANRKSIFRQLNPCPGLGRRTWFVWASFGWILRQALAGHFRKAFGIIVGTWE